MSVINILDQQTANLIAAGEVVDRPAAVAKELLENAIDAGGNKITVEIKNGGSTLIRVSDNGKGMSADDVKACVLRHATSKIKTAKDLEGIVTLGFRGEALAAISSVSRFQIISKEPDAEYGTCMTMEGEKTVSFEEVGSPDGTTVTVRDIFFNVPARRKFLKKDATETAYITQYVERIAISHPEIAIKLISDSKVKFSTSGNGELRDAVYAVFGREFVESLRFIERTEGKVKIRGYISEPEKTRINRNHQILYVNNRLVRSRIISYAVEDAYKSYIMTDRYPAYILFVDIDPYLVDINVHPTKMEVRFVDDTLVRQAIYFAVKNEVEKTLNPIKKTFYETTQENFEKQEIKNAFVPLKEEPPQQQELNFTPLEPVDTSRLASLYSEPYHDYDSVPSSKASRIMDFTVRGKSMAEEILSEKTSYSGRVDFNEFFKSTWTPIEPKEPIDLPIYCGVVFDTYIVAEYKDCMYIIDKHAAHERIIYERLKIKKNEVGIQALFGTRVINLSGPQYEIAMENIKELKDSGFDIGRFGENTIALRGIPVEFSELEVSDCETILVNMLDDLLVGKSAKQTKSEIFDKTLYTAACKAATKAGVKDDVASYEWLLDQLFDLENVFCCPHGRPIIVKYTKSQVEKMFFRT